MRDASHKGRKKGRSGRKAGVGGQGRATGARLNASVVIRRRALRYRHSLDIELALRVSISAVHLARRVQTRRALPMPGMPGWAAAVVAVNIELTGHANLAGRAGEPDGAQSTAGGLSGERGLQVILNAP